MSEPRIVSLVPSLTELVCELGLARHLVGRTGYCIHPHEALANVPKVGGTKTVNIERIRRLAPTHLIVNVDENEKPTVDTLAQFVPQVIVTHPIEVEDNFALYRRFGDLFGARDQAERLCERLAAVLERVDAERFEPLPVLYLIWNDPWMTVSSKTFIARMLARVGLQARAPEGPSRYPALEPAAIGALDIRAALLSSEPCRFRPSDRLRLRERFPATGQGVPPIQGIDGEMTSWYGPRAIAGLQYLLAYRRRLDARLKLRHRPLASAGSDRAAQPGTQAPIESAAKRAGALACVALLGALAACSSTPLAPDAGAGAGAGTSSSSASAGAASTSPGRGRFYLDDGPGDRPLAELAKTPDAVPRAEPLHPRANRPYTVFGRTYEPMTRLEPYRERGTATWYGRRYHGRPTSIGEPYDMYSMTAAHPTLPLPSYARVTNVRTGRSVVVRVNDRGPFLHGRVIDLSYAAAAKLAAALPGSAEVEVELITQFGSALPATLAATPSGTSSSPSSASPNAAAPPVARAPESASGGGTMTGVQAVPVALSSVPVLRADDRLDEAPLARSSPGSTDATSSSASPATAAAGASMSAPISSTAPALASAASLSSATSPAPAARAPVSPSAESASSPSGALAPGRWVQLGAYQSREGAEAALQRLRTKGLTEPVIVRRDGAWHKLVSGPYVQPADAQDAQRRLRAATGIEAFVLVR